MGITPNNSPRKHQTKSNIMDSGSKWISFICVVVLPTTIMGLQCYHFSITDGLTATLKNCSAETKACSISGNKTYPLKLCSNIKTWTGCASLPGLGKSCFCTTDGCNENFETAGVPKQMGSIVSLIFSIIISVIW